MYGVVNQAIQGLVEDNFGRETWVQIRNRAGVDQEFFLNNESYDDSITYDLVGAASEILKVPARNILIDFGKYWILKVGYEKYGDLMKAGGSSLEDFMFNLPNFHGRIMLVYPNLSPPEFKTEKIGEGHLILNYYSHREGLTHFVEGLCLGLAEMFNEKLTITLLDSTNDQMWHDRFELLIH
ncbi:MAG: heme NO-binding protein [Bacteroidetes bacterium]|nr:MAG: heme NO-binding protein [Bacteroidota bacterium]